jgi:hypothetical protein
MSDETDITTQRTRVHLFIEGRLNGKVKVKSFKRLGGYLGRDYEHRKSYGFSSEPSLWETDAENYVNRLVAIITKTSNPSSEQVTEAVKRLYESINVLAQDIEGSNYFMVETKGQDILDWIQTIRAIPDMVHDLSAKMDKRDQDYLEMIIVVKDWMNKYGKVLDRTNEVLSKVNDEIEASKARVQDLGRKP